VNLLLDTHLLIWAAGMPEKLSVEAHSLLQDARNALAFSAASLWEIEIKRGLGRSDFRIDPRRLRQGLLANHYRELPVTGEHAIALRRLPPLHKDPFDRILVVQAEIEGLRLLTSDKRVGQYGGAVQLV
jgi:PIN domain nuclease of toxin-antitoxin system